MIVKKIAYTDFNGQERNEEFHFHMSKAEVVKWMTTNGNYTLDKVLGKLIQSENVKDMIGEVEYLILNSYGEVSLDGKRFIKSEEAKKAFSESEAYSTLFMDLVSDAKKAADFFNGILPDDLAKSINEAIKANPDAMPDVLKDYVGDIANQNEQKVIDMPTGQPG